MITDPCRCWQYNSALGHPGHCCFLRDDRDHLPRAQAWRSDDEVCHVDPAQGDLLELIEERP